MLKIEIYCPECGAVMVIRTTDKYKYPNGDSRKFYGCSRWPECNGIHGAHPDGKPFGVPANKETKQWRMKAHAKFDSLWKHDGLSRGRAYEIMRELMGMTKEEAHIGNFDIEQCKKLIRLLEERRN